MRKALAKSVRVLFLYLTILFFSFGTLFFYWSLRRNKSKVHPELKAKYWAAVADGLHNSNTDMTFWNGKFYLIHAASVFHFGTEVCKLVLRRSVDAIHWEAIKEFKIKDEDIRDPKFAIIKNKLILYVLKNEGFDPEPYDTVLTYTENGEDWADWEQISNQQGWLFWRPKTHDDDIWYLPAYWWDHGKSKLLKSSDGIHWEDISVIYEGLKNDETAIEFLSDGRMICTARLEGSGNYFGDKRGSTLISVAEPPYKNWKQVKSYVTRLDGPVLFRHNGKVYAVGRYQPKQGFLTNQGSILARKRTSIFLVEEDKLKWLTDLPSAGDTTYGGVVIKNNHLYVCYYTNDIKYDYPWVYGMISQSDIMMAKIDLTSLEQIST
ncbi:MAG: hypothetical protein ACFFAO_05870 [Candidatus Hermodarchaeota archaeon]